MSLILLQKVLRKWLGADNSWPASEKKERKNSCDNVPFLGSGPYVKLRITNNWVWVPKTKEPCELKTSSVLDNDILVFWKNQWTSTYRQSVWQSFGETSLSVSFIHGIANFGDEQWYLPPPPVFRIYEIAIIYTYSAAVIYIWVRLG